LAGLLGISDGIQLAESLRQWVEEVLKNGSNKRDAKWSESIAVGGRGFVSDIKSKLGSRAIGRKIIGAGDSEDYELCETQTSYNPLLAPEKAALRPENCYFWDVFSEDSIRQLGPTRIRKTVQPLIPPDLCKKPRRPVNSDVRRKRTMKMIICVALVLSVGAVSLAVAGATNSTLPTTSETNLVFREPFTLKLHVDKDQYYEERYDRKIPFVADNDVYLFCGESFGLKLAVTNGEVATVTYQKDKAGADVEVEFKQEIDKDGNPMTMLVLKSNIKNVLYIDALMTVPERKGIYKTSILPLQPGIMGFESWPHPIVQLVLRNLRFEEKSPNNTSEGIRRPASGSPKPSR